MRYKDRLWKQAKKDFPCDPALQQVHYARLKIQAATEGMSTEEFIKYIRAKAKKVLKEVHARKAQRAGK